MLELGNNVAGQTPYLIIKPNYPALFLNGQPHLLLLPLSPPSCSTLFYWGLVGKEAKRQALPPFPSQGSRKHSLVSWSQLMWAWANHIASLAIGFLFCDFSISFFF